MATVSLWNTEHDRSKYYNTGCTRKPLRDRDHFARTIYGSIGLLATIGQTLIDDARALLLHLCGPYKNVSTQISFSLFLCVAWSARCVGNHSNMHFAFDLVHQFMLRELRTQTSEKRLRIEYFVDSNQVESNIHFIFMGKLRTLKSIWGRSVCVLCVRRKPKPIFNQLRDWAIELRNIHSVKEIVIMLQQQFRC